MLCKRRGDVKRPVRFVSDLELDHPMIASRTLDIICIFFRSNNQDCNAPCEPCLLTVSSDHYAGKRSGSRLALDNDQLSVEE